MTVTWAQLGYKPGLKAAVRDLYAESDLGVFEQGYTATVANYDVAVLRISHPVKPTTSIAGRSSSSSSRGDGEAQHHRVGFSRWLPGWWTDAADTLFNYGSANQHADGVVVDTAADTAGTSSNAGTKRETVWRPWHDAAAQKLQASFRAAAAAGRAQRLAGQQRKRRQGGAQAAVLQAE
jgi:hypothetical protein